MNTQYAIVVSEFNHNITSKLLAGALGRLKECGVLDEHIFVVKVPGAVEIPLAAHMLAKSKKYAAIICLGAVIRGDTDHYDYVCQQVSQGCQRVMMEHEMPVIFGLLTTNNEQQAEERTGGAEGHKGVDAADAAMTMVETMRQLSEMSLSS